MKSVASIFGILLILFGLAALGYQSFTYTQREKVAQLGSLQVTADQEKTVYFPPYLGGASLVAGIVLVVIGRKK
jgi:hypothetical protein